MGSNTLFTTFRVPCNLHFTITRGWFWLLTHFANKKPPIQDGGMVQLLGTLWWLGMGRHPNRINMYLQKDAFFCSTMFLAAFSYCSVFSSKEHRNININVLETFDEMIWNMRLLMKRVSETGLMTFLCRQHHLWGGESKWSLAHNQSVTICNENTISTN